MLERENQARERQEFVAQAEQMMEEQRRRLIMESETVTSELRSQYTKATADQTDHIAYENVVERAILREEAAERNQEATVCLLYTSPSPRDKRQSRMPSSA